MAKTTPTDPITTPALLAGLAGPFFLVAAVLFCPVVFLCAVDGAEVLFLTFFSFTIVPLRPHLLTDRRNRLDQRPYLFLQNGYLLLEFSDLGLAILTALLGVILGSRQ